MKICWKYITPGVILILFTYSIIQYNFASLGDYKYPMWANLMGIAMGVCSTIFVPLYFLYSILIAPGNKVYEVCIFCKIFMILVLIKFLVKSKFYKKRGATFFYDVTRKLGPLDFTQYRSKSSSF